MAPDVALVANPHRRLFAHFPWHLAFIVACISTVGVWNLYSASQAAHAPVWISQAYWMAAGAFIALGLCLVDHRAFQRLAWVFYVLVLVLLVLVMVKGRQVMGARRWLDLGPVHLQPSELAKLSVGMALASFFAADTEKRKDGYGLFGIMLPMGITLLPAVLILKQPDLGTALIVVSVGFTQILFAKVRWKTLALLSVLGVAAAVVGYPHLKPYQKQRLITLVNPDADRLGAGYHSTQSIIAVGSGQGTGKGFTKGTQTNMSFLPEQHTDFIFSVFAEEHGFLGCILLLALYLALLTSAIDIAGAARDRFGHFLAVGLTGMLFWQVLINIGMVIGLLPVVGVTLPLMSYGGSSVLVIYTCVGVLANIGMRRFVN